jgi:hypothetical protein
VITLKLLRILQLVLTPIVLIIFDDFSPFGGLFSFVGGRPFVTVIGSVGTELRVVFGLQTFSVSQTFGVRGVVAFLVASEASDVAGGLTMTYYKNVCS